MGAKIGPNSRLFFSPVRGSRSLYQNNSVEAFLSGMSVNWNKTMANKKNYKVDSGSTTITDIKKTKLKNDR